MSFVDVIIICFHSCLTTIYADGGGMAPAYWGYVLAPQLLDYGCKLLANKRLAVVFDIDETLVQALSQNGLRTRLSAAKERA